MFNKLKKNGLETIAASKKEKGGIWSKDIIQKNLKTLLII